MATLIILHQVANYDDWRRVYDVKSSIADAHGRESARVFRNTDDPNEVAVVETFGEAERIRDLVGSPELAAAMKTAGVVGSPTIHVID